MAYGSQQYGGGYRTLLIADVTVASTLIGGATLTSAATLTTTGAVTPAVSGAIALSATSSLPADGTVISAVHLTGSVDVPALISDAALSVTTPSPDALSGSLSAEISLYGALTIYVPPPPIQPTQTPPPPPPPPPLPPPSLIDDGGTVPLLPSGRILVGVYRPDGTTLISYVPRRKSVSGLNEMNAPGTGTFQIHLDDDTIARHPDILDQFNIVKFFIRGQSVKAWIVEDVAPTRASSGEQADRFVTVSGRGVEAVLEAGVVYPEYGLRASAPEARHFDFTAKDGPWRVPSEWVTPSGVVWTGDTTARHSLPTGWPDALAQWLWSSDPLLSAPSGRNWFRGEFTLSARVNAILYFAADNGGTVFIDGVAIAATDPNTPWTFKTAQTVPMALDAGLHTIAAWVDNVEAGGLNPGGLIISIMEGNAAGDATTTNVWRSTTSTMTVKPYGDAPGWHAANILEQLIIEAQERGVTAVVPLTLGFNSLTDTDNNAWIDFQDRTINVGTTDLLDVATQLIEVAFDMEVTPDMVVNAWLRRGLDYSSTIRVLPGRDALSASATVRGGRVRNQAVLKSASGWVELMDSASKTSYGRREVGLSIGTAESQDQLLNVGKAAVQEIADPETTLQLSFTSVRGPQPFEDFDLGDVVSVPAPFSGMIPARVMSIAFSEEETSIQWDVDFYPHKNADDITVTVTESSGSPDSLYESEVLSDSPWGYWRLHETTGTTLSDLSGRGHPMSIVGADHSLGQLGPVNDAITWGSDPGYATVGGATGKTFQQGIATVECWVFISSNPSVLTEVLGMAVGGVNGTSHDKELAVNTSGQLVWYVSQAGVQHVMTYTTALSLNTWYYVVGSVGPDGQKLYVNGSLVLTDTAVTTSYATQPQQVMLRGGGNTYNGHAPVKVAEPAVYEKQLFDSRIASHYAAVTA